ncbi:hypothetical protein W97_09014 [Coniosporium apollinis CBS 100218]|uniref:Uncharacterized protein n=1 Tax=Coniosporium apollinis (strain CBS 100218) TaxID=1168221 RepID=R7Z753_CONA1|nr:uncharacterized protein W97_09014 [Coniosporium apollinis CBS 100218]EON69751.1 hypothetical protein W97_09014 [Coniosporium apollinis CBS 100218]
MSRDSSHTHLHLHRSHHADLLEDFTRALPTSPNTTNPSLTSPAALNTSTPHEPGGNLPPEPIYVAPEHEPLNPEDEDDVVPDQHAAFGITRATQRKREAAWRDLGLEELVGRGPVEAPRIGLGQLGAAARGGGGGSGLPR